MEQVTFDEIMVEDFFDSKESFLGYLSNQDIKLNMVYKDGLMTILVGLMSNMEFPYIYNIPLNLEPIEDLEIAKQVFVKYINKDYTLLPRTVEDGGYESPTCMVKVEDKEYVLHVLEPIFWVVPTIPTFDLERSKWVVSVKLSLQLDKTIYVAKNTTNLASTAESVAMSVYTTLRKFNIDTTKVYKETFFNIKDEAV